MMWHQRENTNLFKNENYYYGQPRKWRRASRRSKGERGELAERNDKMNDQQDGDEKKRKKKEKKWNGNQMENSRGTWHSSNKILDWCRRFNLYNSVFCERQDEPEKNEWKKYILFSHFFLLLLFSHNRFSSRAFVPLQIFESISAWK